MSKIKALDNDSTAIKVQAELRDPNGPEKIVAATRKAYGDHIDILINNAGISIVKSFLECTPEDYDYVVNLNLRSLFFMTKAVVPHLRSPGRIVNVSSIGARAPFSGLCMYIASKAGVEGLTRALAAELGPLGHTINSVNPGPVQTEMLDLLPKDFINDMVSHTPMERRLGTIDDIAQIVGFLAEERSRWITGQTISASGGYSMY